MLEFNTAFDKEILVIELEGSLDSHSAADFRAWFNEKIAAGYRAFAVDCLCLEFISSAGITALIDVQNILQNQAGKVVLFQLSGETRQLLRFLQLEKKMQIVADYDDAIAALTGIKRVQKPQAPAMVDVTDLKVMPGVEVQEKPLSEKNEKPAESAAPETAPAEAKVAPAAAAIATAGNEVVMEENFSAEKKGLHPVQTAAVAEPPPPPAAAVAPPEPVAPPAATNEAQEIKVNPNARRLISCPNCRSILRVSAAGDYLCPACRFKFVYKGATNLTESGGT
ncbi:MAG: STAS domain-containing protein [Leptospiraceae bacterium]|nr:STAS domain-containing protein [Leptospiraceae bacterium]